MSADSLLVCFISKDTFLDEIKKKDKEGEQPVHVIRVARSLFKFISTGPKDFIDVVKHLGHGEKHHFRTFINFKAHLQGATPQFYSIRIVTIPI